MRFARRRNDMPKRSFEELLRQSHNSSSQSLVLWWRLRGGQSRHIASAAALTRRATQDSHGSLSGRV
jgi:hypothetical protein